MKWYFALNNRSKSYEYLAKAAVESALQNTSLQPVCLYDGEPDEFTAYLTDKGVTVIYHRVSFYKELKKHYSDDYFRVATGAFLRCDIPIIEQSEDFVLYTDCDVLFLREITESDLPKPYFCSCATEVNADDWSVLNTGSMVMNIQNLRETHKEFISFISKNLHRMDTYDQAAYNLFYKDRIEKLDLAFNWKPYWAPFECAAILHFHGPKPEHVNALLREESVQDIYKHLFFLNPPGYFDSMRCFQEYSPGYPFERDAIETVVVKKLAEQNAEYRDILARTFLDKVLIRVRRIFPF